ncbi:MAG TPA: DUF998 domain-containing protein [Candidatus Saccharimonadales bacterium]|nr:DUF998 domain-containing protein [Candidatus Saccharimonadales bacterium]
MLNIKSQSFKLVSLGIASGVLYSLWILGYFLNRSAFSHLDLSALQSRGQPYSSFFILGDILTGIVVIWMAYSIRKVHSKGSTLDTKSLKLCLIGLVAFGVFTAISCLLPSCIANSRSCDNSLSQLFDLHNVTGTIASVGLFVSLLNTPLIFRKKGLPQHLKAAISLLIVWSVSGLLFIFLSVDNQSSSIPTQKLFLVLSSICLVVIPLLLTRSGIIE